MIPNTEKQILISENWKKIYQSFSNSDFKSYDFETLKRTMILYLQENYPENFNDYIDSSEYIALIDIIAFLGQNLSFRIDLNARENFLETAERRDSVLRLAQLISYNPKRNSPASGLLKITSMSTTENIFDSNGTNLSNTVIAWNDVTNSNWYQQFINILNEVFTTNFGNPLDSKVIEGISTELYSLRSNNTDVPIFTFSKNINGQSTSFEIVSSTFFQNDSIIEEEPRPGAQFNVIYKNDNRGSSSVNSGFFVHFKQGTMNSASFSLDNPVPNEIIGININDINDTDTWLWQINKDGNFEKLWTKIQTVSNNSYNTIYNSINKNNKTFYTINSRIDDQIDLVFSDGVFGDLPKGNFRFFYRQSNGNLYSIKPEEMNGIVISIPYISKLGQLNTIELTLSLQYTVSNSSPSESNDNIRLKAPQNYYLQNRLITGEDYNIGPLTLSNNILKSKSINRVSSGLSRYFDIIDISGKYSSTSIFSDDGILYREEKEEIFEFTFTNRNQILSVLKNNISNIFLKPELQSLYFLKYPRILFENFDFSWNRLNQTTNQSRGYIQSNFGPQAVGDFSSSDLKFLKPGSLIKFVAPFGKYFDNKNNLKNIPLTSSYTLNLKKHIWASVFQVIGDGANGGVGALSDGTGPIILSVNVPSGAILVEILPKFNKSLKFSLENEIANICLTQRNFGLTVNNLTREWDIISNSNLNLTLPFSLDNQFNNENLSLDSSWIIAFIWDGTKYIVKYRILDYIFESLNNTAFYVDKNSINFDFLSNTVVKDKIEILSLNLLPNESIGLITDYYWQIDNNIIEKDGYVNSKKVKVSMYDFNNTGQITDPDMFDIIVGTDTVDIDTGFKNKFLFFKKSNDEMYFDLTDDLILIYPDENTLYLEINDLSILDNNSLFYFYKNNKVKYWSTTINSFVDTDNYIGRYGRRDIRFHYVHNANNQRRIDPSKTNIIDIYVLTSSYDTLFRAWISNGMIGTKPLPPSSVSLAQDFKNKINEIKSISDEVIFHPVNYKILFGNFSDSLLQATFKAVRKESSTINDSNLKTNIFSAINEFFSIENWEFGQTFYFSELSAYVMNKLTPDITNFIIVPKSNIEFGNLYEISCLPNEIFISGLTINDIEIINTLSISQTKSSLGL